MGKPFLRKFPGNFTSCLPGGFYPRAAKRRTNSVARACFRPRKALRGHPGRGGLPGGAWGCLAPRVPGGSLTPRSGGEASAPREVRALRPARPNLGSPRRGLLAGRAVIRPAGFTPRARRRVGPRRGLPCIPQTLRSSGNGGCTAPPPWGGLGPWLPSRVATTPSALRGRVTYARQTLRPYSSGTIRWVLFRSPPGFSIYTLRTPGYQP